MKNNFSYFLALLILVFFAACGSGDGGDSSNNDASDGPMTDDAASDGPMINDAALDVPSEAGEPQEVDPGTEDGVWFSSMVVLANNDLGMHCMNQDFSTFMILPPYNTIHAQVIKRNGGRPVIVEDGVDVTYEIPGNTSSVDNTNFWTYAPDLFGVTLEDDIGLAGFGLSGTMTATGNNDWAAVGIPLTPIDDLGNLNSFQLGLVKVFHDDHLVAQTKPVVPVSWEISCDMCHPEGDGTLPTGQDILHKHDLKHGTTLETDPWPIFCGSCHMQPELGAEGDPMTSTLSGAMHTAHAGRMRDSGLDNYCYACHPGPQTHCLRDVMYHNGMECISCHGGMLEVGDPSRQPWSTEPRCGECHTRKGFEFEQPGTLFRNSKGHYGVHCTACHGSPHAINPSTRDEDNVQSVGIQGYAGPIGRCSVCHTDDVRNKPFEHKFLPPTGKSMVNNPE